MDRKDRNSFIVCGGLGIVSWNKVDRGQYLRIWWIKNSVMDCGGSGTVPWNMVDQEQC